MSRDGSPVVRAVSDEGEYTWAHRAFLQAFQTRGVMTVDEMKPVLAHVLSAHNPERPWSEGDVTQPQITNTVQTINAKINPFDLEIRSTREQHTRVTIYALINNTCDSLTQLATKFTPGEIAYIRRLLDCMFETNNTHNREIMAIKHTEASQLARPSRRNRQSQLNGNTENDENSQTPDPGISIQEADDILDALVNESFFQKSRAGYFSLASRALLELRAYLKETYNEAADDNEEGVEIVRIRDCDGCHELVTIGVRCNNRECGIRWHDACANFYFRGRRKENRKCPKCGMLLSGEMYVGERVVTAGARTSTGMNGSSTQAQMDEEEED